MTKRLFFKLLFTLFLVSQVYSQNKVPDYIVDIDRRRTFWVPLTGHGWLYSGAKYDLAEKLPESFQNGDPILSGKKDSELKCHFLLRFRFSGDYYLNFFNQDFELQYPDETKKNSDNQEFNRVVFIRVIDSRKQIEGSVNLTKGRITSALVLEKEDSDKEVSTTKSVKIGKYKTNHSNHTKLKPKQQPRHIKKTIVVVEKEQSESVESDLVSIDIETDEISWEEHVLFPFDSNLNKLLDIEKNCEIDSEEISDEVAFQLALYYFTLQTPKAIKRAFNLLKYIYTNYPASSFAKDAKKRSDYISDYYMVIR